MVVTQFGPTGLVVTSHAMKELSVAHVLVSVPRLQTVETIAADWDQLQNHKVVIHNRAQVGRSCSVIVIVWLWVVLKQTVAGDYGWRFDNLNGSYIKV